MLLRDERPQDRLAIARIHQAAFRNHPAHPPGAAPVEHRIAARLRAAGALTLSLLAETDGLATGHLALSPARVGTEAEGWFLLGPLGVLPAFQGRGIGSALVAEALRRMGLAKAAGVVLVGDPAFYARRGFADVAGLTWPGVPDRHVLAACLDGRAPAGDIVAHEAFALAFENSTERGLRQGAAPQEG